MRRPSLTETEIETFHERGFLVVESVFDDDEIAEMRGAFERLERRARRLEQTQYLEGTQFVVDASKGATRIERIVWCGGAEPTLGDYGRDPRLVDRACRIIGTPRVEQLINQAHFKFPGDDVSFEWHQDSKHRRYGTDLWSDVTGRGSFVETATAIDPMRPDNGPLEFIPGTGQLGHVDPDPETGKLPDSAFDPDRAVTATLEPGDVVLFGPYTIHGSGTNHSETPRRLFLNGYAHPDANERDYPGEDAGRLLTST